jgi:beta-glucosidase
LIAEDWNIHHPASTQTKKIHLEKDRPYPIKIEYFQNIRSSEARLIWSLPDQGGQQALEAARSAGLVIMVLGLSPRIEGEEMKVDAEGFAGGDRTRIDLPAPQEQLLERIHAVGKPTVLVLVNGSALAINWADENVPAIVEAWYPGEEGGTAVARVLAGDFSPAGRLPITFYKSTDQLPAFEDYSMAKRTYRYFDGEPLYPFGYGLSYTSFSYSQPRADKASVSAAGEVTVSVDIANTGAMAGDEVVQLYLTHPGVAGAPLRALNGFQRVHLDRDQKKSVSFTLRERDLSIVDESGKRRIVSGKVEVWIGGGQPVTRAGLTKTAGASTQFTITTEATLPD